MSDGISALIRAVSETVPHSPALMGGFFFAPSMCDMLEGKSHVRHDGLKDW